MATPEGRIKAKVSRLLKTYGTDLYYFMPVQNGFGSSTLDYLGFAKGRGFAVETKADATKKPTKRQEIVIGEIEAAGAKTFVIYDDATLSELRHWLDRVFRDAPTTRAVE